MERIPLIRIESTDFAVIISGNLPRRNSYAGKRIGNTHTKIDAPSILLEALDEKNNVSFCIVELIDKSYFEIIDVEYKSLDEDGMPLPIFFEQVEYTLYFEVKGNKQVQLEHDDPHFLIRLGNIKAGISVGPINFRNNVGYTNFFIKIGQKKIIKLSFFVYPVKLDYFKQRRVMLNDIDKLHDSILLDLLRPTTDKSSSSNSKKSTGLEWLTLFNQYVEHLVKLVSRIELKSHSRIHKIGQHKQVSKIKGSNKSLLKASRKFGLDTIKKQQSKLYSEKKILTNNTAENKYIKFLIRQLIKTGRKWKNYLETDYEKRKEEIKESPYYLRISDNIKSLERKLKGQFWESVEDETKSLLNKGNFGFHQEFIKTEGIIKKIKRGLELDSEGREIVYTLGMDKLYEVWVYVKIAEIITVLLNKEQNPLKLKYSTNGFSTSLATGLDSKVKITDDIFLLTNRLFTKNTNPYRIPIINQKPDIILELAASNILVVLDAKYRLSVYAKKNGKDWKELTFSNLIMEDYNTSDLVYFVKDDDINVIHRYRDAIYVNEPNKYKHAVAKGLIIFPGILSNESLNESKFIYDKFNISFLPLIPGETDLNWKTTQGYNFTELPESDVTTERIRALGEVLKDLLQKYSSVIILPD